MSKRRAEYTPFGVSLTEGQQETMAKAVQAGVNLTIRLTNGQLHGKDSLALTKRQITHIERKRAAGAGAEVTLSKTQLKHMAKTGGFLPFLPLILGGLAAAGSLAGGSAAIAKAVDDKKASARAQAEAERHNREVEKQLKGSGLFLSKTGGCCPKCKGSGLYLGPSKK
jgi:hypothetical protein